MLKNNKGLTLIELMVGLGFVGMAVFGLMSLQVSMNKTSSNIETFQWLDILRTEIITNLKNETSWRNIVLDSNNTSLNCLRPKYDGSNNPVNCSGVSGEIQVIRNQNNQIVFVNSNAQSGKTQKGQDCSNFSELTGNSQCPFRYVVRWRAQCGGSLGCSNPDVVVSAQLQVSTNSNDILVNPSLYGFSLFLQTGGERKFVTCQQAQLGTYDGTNCDLNVKSTVCTNPNQFLVGFQPNGTPICQSVSLLNGGCGAGLVLNGVNPDGTPSCVPTCI